MKPVRRIARVLVVMVALEAVLAGCSRGHGYNEAAAEPSCGDLLTAAIQYERSGTGDIDSVLQALSDSCSDHYEIAVDYVANANAGLLSTDSCEEWLSRGLRTEAVDLLAQDGHCGFAAPAAPAAPAVPAEPVWPENGLGWDAARNHVGTVQRICGPLASLRVTDDGSFFNVGRDHPSADRFTIIFWDIYFDPIETGATICGSGEVYLYEGVAQMEMRDPDALEIWR